MKRIITDLVILIIIGSLLWAAFAFFIKLPENPTIISEEKEQIMGEKFRDAILKMNSFSKFESAGVDSILAIYSQSLSSLADTGNVKFNITLVKSEMVNAFALPGGNIIITTGLVNFCDSTSELTGVLSHEAGHIVKRHLITRLIKEIGFDLLGSDNTYITGEITRGIISTGYDRKQEEEADLYSCELLSKAGFEPRIPASFLRKLKEHNKQELFENFELLSSHPDIDKRIKYILEYRGEPAETKCHFPEISIIKEFIKDQDEKN